MTLLLVLPIFADGLDGGGDGGIINLPNAKWNNARSNTCRAQVTRDNYHDGVIMRLPSEMREAVAMISYASQQIPLAIVDGELILDGESLGRLRGASVYQFEVTVIDKLMYSILITVEMSPENQKLTLKIW